MRIGTRGSLLARRQSQLVADALAQAHPDVPMEWVVIQTSGDRITDRPLYEAGGKGLFVRELELALLDHRIDLAVHSYKDVPVTMPLVSQHNLMVAAVPRRASPGDVLVTRTGAGMESLSPGCRIGTGSLRRKFQILAHDASFEAVPIRGNIDTRLKKWADGEVDALILAQSGLERAGLYDSAIMTRLPLETMLPAAGQGALALQCRKDDRATRQVLAVLHDAPTGQCVAAERRLVELLQGDCHSPIAALAEMTGDDSAPMRMRAMVAGTDEHGGIRILHAQGMDADANRLVRRMYERLCEQGARQLLHGSEESNPSNQEQV